tara:strand:+ start:2360 stop:4198 length:1839 start_codon:yes stop_codon:yes gene_type:complete
MSWQDVLKEKKIEPKKVKPQVMGYNEERKKFHRKREEKLRREKESAKTKDANLFDFGKQEAKEFPIKPNTPTFNIWQAASKDDTWADYTKDGLTSSQVQSVQKAKRLLQGEVVNIRGTDFKLSDPPFSNVDEMVKRLENIQPKKTKLTGKRASVTKNVKSFIDTKNYEGLLTMLEGRGKERYAEKLSNITQRARRYIQENKSLRRAILTDTEDKYPELKKIKEILKIGGVPQVEIGTSIGDDVAIDYVKKIMNIVSPKKVEFIYEEKSDAVAKSLFGTRAMSPALEFILENEALNQSAIPTAYKKRYNVEERALRRIIDEAIKNPSITNIYDKYKDDIIALYGRKGETTEQRESRLNLLESNRDKFNTVSRKGNKAKRDMFADIKEDEEANADFEKVMSEVEGDTSQSMTEEIRDEIVDALEGSDEDGFMEAIEKLGIKDSFKNFRELEEELGDSQKVEDALKEMTLRRSDNTMVATSKEDKKTLKYFESQKVDAWSILEDVISDDLTPSINTESDGTLDRIVITLKRLSELYDGPEIDEEDLEEGEITTEEFKKLVIESYPKIRELFLAGVKDRMKDISAEGKVMGKKIPSPEGGFVEPAIWVQIAQGVRE